MPKEDTTPAPTSASLAFLDDRWTIAVGQSHRRYVGGHEGQRFATDGGQMVIIDEAEFANAKELGWGVIPAGDHWATKSGREKTSSHYLAGPDEVAPLTHGLALRYGRCWVAAHYVEVAILLGGTRFHVSSPTSGALVPGLCVIMPVDMDRHDEDTEVPS